MMQRAAIAAANNSGRRRTAAPAPASALDTSFAGTESPISEGGIWHQVGSLWTKVRTTPGKAFGTQIDDSYDDSYAYLTGYGNDYELEATIFVDPAITGSTHEVELLLRMQDGNSPAPFAKCYEMDCLLSGQVIPQRWNGDMGDFTTMTMTGSGTFGRQLITGDILKARIQGSTITVYANGLQILTGTETTYPVGDPGMGFFFRVPGGGSVNQLGFSRLKCTPL